MERRKKPPVAWLIAVPVILGTLFAIWQCPCAGVEAVAGGVAADETPGKCTPPPGNAHKTSGRKVRPAHVPLEPRLLPDVGMAAKENGLPHRLIPLTIPVKKPAAKTVQTQHLQPQPRPVQQPRQTQTPDAAGPCYSWLLENRADMPADGGFRSHELERIACEADKHIRHGFSLANRGAFYSARTEFVKALRLVAQGLDVEHQTSVHGHALRAGLMALKESDDFIPSGSQLETDLDFPTIVGAHQTPVLKLSQPRTLTSLEALRRYFSFAQYQLAIAAGNEVAGSMALHAMAKLYASSAGNATVNILSAKPKAMTCFQAALVAYPRNYMAANDLGVLLANSQRFEDARNVLERSVEMCPHSATWQNLAVVYGHLGLPELAASAELNRQQARQLEIAHSGAAVPGASDPRVLWLTPQQFAATYAQTSGARQPLPVQQKPAQVQTRESGNRLARAKSHEPPPPASTSKDGPLVESKKDTTWSWNVFRNVFK